MDDSAKDWELSYPHIPPAKVAELIEVEASPKQWEKVNQREKEKSDQRMLSYQHGSGKMKVMVIGTSGSGKSATANTLLGKRAFEEVSSAKSVTASFSTEEMEGLGVVLVDSPGSWNTMTGPGVSGHIDFYIIVINLASPRFGHAEREHMRGLQGADGKKIVGTGRCMVVLTHADSVLRDGTLDEHLDKLQHDALHQFLFEDIHGQFLAVNNNVQTEYERDKTQKAMLGAIMRAMGTGLSMKDVDSQGMLNKFGKLLKRCPAEIQKLFDKYFPDKPTTAGSMFYNTETGKVKTEKNLEAAGNQFV